MAEKALDQHQRKGSILFELQKMFPTDPEAQKWVENIK